jgi:hypothetical protein
MVGGVIALAKKNREGFARETEDEFLPIARLRLETVSESDGACITFWSGVSGSATAGEG